MALGLPDGTLGVAWPSIRADLGRPVSALGVLLVAQTAGYLVASAGNGVLVARLGTGALLTGAAATAAVGLLGYVAASPWAVLVLASVVIGAAAGAVDAGVNAHVAVHHGRRSMGLLHAAFGIGATAGPLLVTGLLRAELSWRWAYALLVGAQLVLLVAFARSRRSWSGTAGGRPAAGAPDEEVGGATAPGTARRATLPLALGAFFVYTGLEIATGQWAYSLLTEERGVGAATAGLWVAAYWGALTVGRLGLAVGAERVAPSALLAGSAVATVVGTTLLWVDPVGLGAAGLPVIGLGLAPVFPTLVSLTPLRFGPDRAAHAVGYQLAAAGIGAALLPGAVALAIDLGGLGVLAPSLALLAVVLAGLHAAAHGATVALTPLR